MNFGSKKILKAFYQICFGRIEKIDCYYQIGFVSMEK